jgi:hypothetical protein
MLGRGTIAGDGVKDFEFRLLGRSVAAGALAFLNDGLCSRTTVD